MIALLWIVAALTFCAALRKAWRDATAADREELSLDYYRRRVNRHRHDPDVRARQLGE